MKRLSLLILAGGLLAGVAFFLPYTLAHSAAGVFSAGKSFKGMLNDSLFFVGTLQSDRGLMLLGYASHVLEPAGVLLLLGSALGLIGAVLGLLERPASLLPTEVQPGAVVPLIQGT